MSPPEIPVIALTGFLGAGKTSVLNHLLRAPGARIGVVVNDIGDIAVDAALVRAEVDQTASIGGGCLCCLPDAGGLDATIEILLRAGHDLDAIMIEASGVAEPVNLARLLRTSRCTGVRFGGIVEVLDAVNAPQTVDAGPEAAARFRAASLVVLTKTDLLDAQARTLALRRTQDRVRSRNPHAVVVEAQHGAVDPRLILDLGQETDPPGELPLASLVRQARAQQSRSVASQGSYGSHHHVHAQTISLPAAGPVDAGRLADLLQAPPVSAYRLKGVLDVADQAGRPRRVVIHVVAGSVHLSSSQLAGAETGLVAIGSHLSAEVRPRLVEALRPAGQPSSRQALSRLERIRRQSRGL